MDYPKASMCTPAAHLKAPLYISREENKAFKLPDSSSTDILTLNFTPSLCRQDEQGPMALCDYMLQQRLCFFLNLSAKMKREADAAQENSQSIFRKVFGSNCEFVLKNLNKIFNLLITWNKVIGNTIDVFFQIDSHGERATPTSYKATLEDTQALGSSFEQIDIGDKGFYVALDKNYDKIFVVFGAGLKMIYGDKIGEYVEKTMIWNIEEYASVNPAAIPKDTWHKDYEE
ncbi:hypothetical protein B9Z19DRAFT_1061686 [Tuber borchii]|uniref:Uncharacterized protein n=1 Tax=Tuber borchii TaxID=42251 RepID=A0A2T7A4B6_TUBBO|nr:hypothetical protein B9Z19DRAFT_1061686 [Tuber borchii]